MVSAIVSCTRESNNNETNKAIDEDRDINEESDDDKEKDLIGEEYSQVEEENPVDEEALADDEDEQSDESVLNETPEGSDDEDTFDATVDSSGLSNTEYSWSFKRNSTHQSVTGYSQGIDLDKYDAYFKVNTEEKVIYLTFDEGYENGYTGQILDTLQENDVQAAFFVTKPYIESSPDLCLRMKQEGHIVANHSVTHSSFPELSNEQIKEELEQTAAAYKELTGYEMDPFFRTPSGKFSERVLNEVRKQGYSSIFWSLAYGDWDVNKQPGAEFVYDHILVNHHPGGIFLLHAVSKSNTEALDRVLKALKDEGYRFGSLYELE
jgi:peptidoglycan-N-acetylmuramic acid deacetylase